MIQLKQWPSAGAIGLATLGLLAWPAQAQIQGDGTLGTQVNGALTAPCAGTCNITDGSTRGGNLFHSFQQFSLPNGDVASFQTLPAIQNVIVRVTGVGSPFISNINGTIATSSPANFFLLNPNGIVFGPGATLDIGGSFLATTAERMVFQDGMVLSTRDPAPLLTVSIPTGLQFGQSSGNIQTQGTFLSVGIRDNFEDFALVGGNVMLDDTTISALGRRVELGTATAKEAIGISLSGNNLSLGFPESLTREDISITKGSLIDVTDIFAGSSGRIVVNARNLNISDSLLDSGVLGNANSQTGDTIILDATNTIKTSRSTIRTIVDDNVASNTGNLRINAQRLTISDGAILNSTRGIGNAGNVIVKASESIDLVEGGILGSSTFGDGNSGNVEVATKRLTLQGGSFISASSFSEGQGKGGDLTVSASDVVEVLGTSPDGKFSSGLTTETDGSGKSGDLRITTGRLIVRDGGVVKASTSSSGQGGSIIVDASEVELRGGSPDNSFSSGLFS